jgi:hypothetical protein
MHPVARVSTKYWNNLRTQQSIFGARFYCALLTLYVSAPFGVHLQVVCCFNTIFYILPNHDIYLIPPHRIRLIYSDYLRYFLCLRTT